MWKIAANVKLEVIYVNNQCLPWEEGELCSNSIFYPNFNHTYLCQMLSVTFSSKTKYIYCDWPPTQVQDSSISPLSMWNSSFGSKIMWDYYSTFFFKNSYCLTSCSPSASSRRATFSEQPPLHTSPAQPALSTVATSPPPLSRLRSSTPGTFSTSKNKNPARWGCLCYIPFRMAHLLSSLRKKLLGKVLPLLNLCGKIMIAGNQLVVLSNQGRSDNREERW